MFARLGLLLVIVIYSGSISAKKCVCDQTSKVSIDQLLKDSSFIATGTVEDITDDPNDGQEYGHQLLYFNSLDVLRGQPSKKLKITTRWTPDCGYTFWRRKTYLIYQFKNQQNKPIQCRSRIVLLEKYADEFKLIQKKISSN